MFEFKLSDGSFIALYLKEGGWNPMIIRYTRDDPGNLKQPFLNGEDGEVLRALKREFGSLDFAHGLQLNTQLPEEFGPYTI